jgi:formamidopyrimidine-DNA glycosylase
MPELPEVETTARILKTKLVGKKISDIKIFSPKQFPDNPKLVIGSKITDVKRRAKILVIYLDKFVLTAHLKLTGQFVYADKTEGEKAVFGHPIPLSGGNSLPGRSTRVVLKFTDQSALFFNDLRKFGWIKILAKNKFNIETFSQLGVEPFSDKFTSKALKLMFDKTKRAVKTVLMDQKIIAGIGNIYANEALFFAKIHPQRPANSLSKKEIDLLKKAVLKVLEKGIANQGTSAADDAYIKPDGSKGKNQNYLSVYQKTGKDCIYCKGKIKKITIGGRGTFFCPICQK